MAIFADDDADITASGVRKYTVSKQVRLEEEGEEDGREGGGRGEGRRRGVRRGRSEGGAEEREWKEESGPMISVG